MGSDPIYNVNVISERVLLSPNEIKSKLPRSADADKTVLHSRGAVERILDRKDPRLFIVVGPCSIHDISLAHEYAGRLHALSKSVEDVFLLVMRVYFEKPRTVVGWKGFINDPHMDDSFRIEEGLHQARELLLYLAELGIPAGTEALDPLTPQYLNDLISWSAIGARTTESQTHREISSGLSTPVGFKNGTDGGLEVAINALRSVREGHHFLGIDLQGRSAVFQTRGNRYGHLVLRGGSRPNYDSVSIATAEHELRKAGLPVNIVVDCSHGNSLKNHALQPLVFENCVNQLLEGNRSIVGMMLESNINAGNQSIPGDLGQLKYGVSVTDACIDWATTDEIIRKAAASLRPKLKLRS